MKNIIQIITACLILTSTFPVSAHSPNSILNVTASSGLNLRAEPGPHGQVIKTIPMGEQVTLTRDELGLGYADRIDWVDGEWVLVMHEDDIGYVFDGFLTSLPLPNDVNEFSSFDLDLSGPLKAYAKNNFLPQAAPDTILGSNTIAILESYVQGHLLRQQDTDFHHRVSLDLVDTNVMEAYYILFNMLSSKAEKASFLSNSTFIEDELGKIRRVKIDIDHPIFITKNEENTSVKVLSFREGCTL